MTSKTLHTKFLIRISAAGLMLFLSSTNSLTHAEIYSWEDEHGNTVYGDTPRPNQKTENVELKATTVLSFPKEDEAEDDDESQDAQATIAPYNSLSVVSPTQNQTIRDNSGQVIISLNATPPLQPGHSFQIILDGKAITTSQQSSASLSNVDRGSHTISAKIIDADGKVHAQSKSITFHLHRFISRPSS